MPGHNSTLLTISITQLIIMMVVTRVIIQQWWDMICPCHRSTTATSLSSAWRRRRRRRTTTTWAHSWGLFTVVQTNWRGKTIITNTNNWLAICHQTRWPPATAVGKSARRTTWWRTTLPSWTASAWTTCRYEKCVHNSTVINKICYFPDLFVIHICFR